MKGYDSLLFRALIGANQLEFKENMDSAESAEYSYSPRYNRFHLQILADPFRWAKKRRRPMWQKIITNVACIILVCSIALGGLMVVSPTVRAVVLNWLRDISGNRITYFSNGDNSLTADRASWRPTWLPEGWVVTDIYSRSSRSWWSFKDSNGSGASLTCACFDPSEESMSTIIDTDEIDKAHTTVTIQEYTADLYEGENDALLVWEDKNGYLFWIKGWMVDRETVEQIANSMTYYQEDGISYEVGDVLTLKVNGSEETYTIAGLMGINSFEFQKDGMMGSTLVTKLDHDTAGQPIEIALSLKDPKEAYTFAENLKEEHGFSQEQIITNDMLLQFEGGTRSEQTMQVLYRMAVIVILIIIFTSVFVIKNSFDISIMERIKQYPR